MGVSRDEKRLHAHTSRADGSSHVPLLERMWVVAALAVIACALWGSAFAAVKTGYALFGIAADSPAQQLLFAGMRFSLAGVMVLVGTAVARRRIPLPSRADLKPIALLALTQTALQYAPFYMGLAHASGTNSALVQGTSAFVSIVIATLVFRQERLTARKLVGCLLGIGGVALVTLREGGMLGAFSLEGEGLILVSVICGATASCLMRSYGVTGDPLMLTGWQFVVGGLALVALGLLLGGRVESCSVQAVGVLAYLAALSATAFSLWSSLLKHNPVSRVAVFRFFIPVFGVIFSVVVLGEVVPAGQVLPLFVALALIVGGTVLVNTE